MANDFEWWEEATEALKVLVSSNLTFETSIWKSALCLRLVRYLFGDEKPEKNKFKHRYQVSKIFVEKGLSLAFLKKNRPFSVMSEKSNTFAFELSWASQSKLTNSPLTTSSPNKPIKVEKSLLNE